MRNGAAGSFSLSGSWSIGTYSSWAAVVAGACGVCVAWARAPGAPAADEQQQEGNRARDAIEKGHSLAFSLREEHVEGILLFGKAHARPE